MIKLGLKCEEPFYNEGLLVEEDSENKHSNRNPASASEAIFAPLTTTRRTDSDDHGGGIAKEYLSIS
jgi:hypothetical protein